MHRIIAAFLILVAGAAFASGQGEGALRLVARGVDNGSMSPDGKSVLVQGADGILSIYDLQSGGSRKVLSGSVMISRLDPAGKRILMLASGAWKGTDYYGLWIANVDGSGFRPFLAEPDLVAEDRYPLWSDDGKAVVWTRDGRLWTAAADGRGAKALTPAKKGPFIVPLDWMGDELLVSETDDLQNASTVKRLNLRTGATVDTGLKQVAAAFFGSADRVICYDDELLVWDVAGRREERRVRLAEEAAIGHSLSRSADCSRYLLSSGDSMDTSIEHLFVFEWKSVPAPAKAVSPNADLEAPEIADLVLALRSPLPRPLAEKRGLIALPKGYPADRALALERLNLYRLAAGLAPYSYDPLLSGMGQAHADYILANAGTGAAGGHFELPGARLYTKAGDEAARTSGISYGLADPLAALEELMGGAFHRLQFLRPSEVRVGLGHSFGPPASANSINSGGTLFVTREGAGPGKPAAPRFVLFPPDGFDDALTAFPSGENPDPRPGIGPGAPATGYPITISLLPDDVDKFEGASVVVKEEGGAALPIWLSYPGRPAVADPDLGIYADDKSSIAESYRDNFGAVFVLPKAPLGKGKTYSVRAELRIGGKSEILSWSFATRGPTLWTVRPSSPDPRESFASALESASDGDVILMTAGEYSIGKPLFIDRALRLAGEPGRTILRYTGPTGTATIVVSGRAVIEGLDFVGYFNINASAGSGLLLKDCRFAYADELLPLSGLERGSCLALEGCDLSSYASPYLAYFRDYPAASAPPTLYLGAGNAFGPLTYEGKRSYGPGVERILKRRLE